MGLLNLRIKVHGFLHLPAGILAQELPTFALVKEVFNLFAVDVLDLFQF